MTGRPAAIRVLALPLALLACAAHGPAPDPGCVPDPAAASAPAEPAAAPASSPAGTPAPTTGSALRCLPFATCGCFSRPECVAGRVRDDGYTFDIVGGPRDGETAHLSQHCPRGSTDPADCGDYVDPAMICRRLQPADVRSAKYLCSMDDVQPDWECGFRDGACTVL